MARIELPSHIKASILSHRSCLYLEDSARRCLDALMLDDKYQLVIDVINRLLSLTADGLPEWRALRDFALIQCAAER